MATKDEHTRKIEQLLRAIDRVYPSTRELLWKSFLRGLFTGLGATIGVSLVLGVLTFLFDQLELLPIIGELVEETQIGELFTNK